MRIGHAVYARAADGDIAAAADKLSTCKFDTDDMICITRGITGRGVIATRQHNAAAMAVNDGIDAVEFNGATVAVKIGLQQHRATVAGDRAGGNDVASGLHSDCIAGAVGGSRTSFTNDNVAGRSNAHRTAVVFNLAGRLDDPSIHSVAGQSDAAALTDNTSGAIHIDIAIAAARAGSTGDRQRTRGGFDSRIVKNLDAITIVPSNAGERDVAAIQ